ncbi:L-carnitine dehydratase/bile acid-inducible protein F [Cupriavidus taiwanensis]|uniref:L-carnitine dehydratase/bile acid-inducible protein F n=1 Tax=Cupriavidus taiwanensis TaxID=164546 RepID=A0A375CFQ1_9BURK|nr:CoA transferase [Cupriavidus taiwanensis]SOY68890.1 L-carnitine dehydratase/bile acid-inducible protein F [Cupriavidus taiwanensis]
MTGEKQIFDGLKVLDLTRIIAGPLCTQIMADFGAEVYKIERPQIGDDSRRMAPLIDSDKLEYYRGESTVFASYNRGKKSIAIDFTKPAGAEAIAALAATCDVVIENFKSGDLARYGLDYESIRGLRPDIIYCSITGFGRSGPYASYPAYDFILQALAGPMSTCGRPEGEPGSGPLRTAIPIVDLVTGLYANSAIASALFHRARTGQGQFIETSLLNCGVALNGHFAGSYLLNGLIPRATGNSNPIAAPSELIWCSDGAVVFGTGNDRQFSSLCSALSIENVACDVRFSNNSGRIQNRSELTEILAAVMAPLERDSLIELLRSAGVPCGPINDMAQVFDDPQVRHNEIAINLDHPDYGSFPTVRHPVFFSQTPARERHPPQLGVDTMATLTALGFSESEIVKMSEAGAI